MTWTCPTCMTEWPEKPLVDGTIGCPSCGNVAASVYHHVRKESLLAGSACDVDPPYETYDVVERRAYDNVVAERDTLREQRDQLLGDLDNQRLYVAEYQGYAQIAGMKLKEAEARAEALRDALKVYADPKHWAIRRTDSYGDRLGYPDCVWIGPGALETVPNALGVARAALTRSGQQEKSNE